jgi:hypothetical protein
MKKLFSILALITLTHVAHARLSETPDEVTARYGAGSVVTGTNDDSYIESFDHNGFKIMVTFRNGKDAQEVLYKQVAGEPVTIFQQDGDKLFQDISGGGKIVAERSGHSSLYTNKINGATGMLDGDCLTVQTKAYADYVDKKYADKTKGF